MALSARRLSTRRNSRRKIVPAAMATKPAPVAPFAADAIVSPQVSAAKPSVASAAPAKEIAGGTADEQKGAQRQQIAIHNPRKAVATRGKTRADRRQPDIDHRAVDESQAGGENGRCEDHLRMIDQSLAGFGRWRR